MYKYFVSYHYSNGVIAGFGHLESEMPGKITGIEDIRNLAKSIERDFGVTNVIIINYRLFD